MLTLATRLKNIAFLIIGAIAIGYLGVNYADLGRYVGVTNYYEVTVELAETGGLYEHADVTYRGVSVGRVGPIELTDQGIEATIRIENSAPDIPQDTDAAVESLSAIGEQFLDLRPRTDSGPFLGDGARITQNNTTTPPPVTDMLASLNDLVGSVPLDSLETVMTELGTGLEGQGDRLGGIIEAGNDIVAAAQEVLPDTTRLIVDSQTVLATQAEMGDALTEFAEGAALLSQQLVDSDQDIRDVIDAAPGAAGEIDALLRDTNPGLSVLIANLLTTSDLMITRQGGIEELMVRAPQVIAAGSTAVTPNGINGGLALTFFQPMPCTAGYGGTTYRNGLDTRDAPLNTEARCTASPGSGVNVRGSQNAPSGGVPDAARAGSVQLPGALGLPGTGGGSNGSGSGGGGLGGLLGLD
ncbi:MlaD family protein [Streptomyces sp. DSM 44917]|uniref:MlaD family protein n=1 Tax=Streptomyces boetiae TaxID=3075541 RepID=A0ABU2L8P7_9ACTN|nr:MlaD family protein [Streptomyces sp. DSM 44917]MDT0307945.1 MlaD family protein [Streptomyces sp. DSM 44917]